MLCQVDSKGFSTMQMEAVVDDKKDDVTVVRKSFRYIDPKRPDTVEEVHCLSCWSNEKMYQRPGFH